MLCSELRVWRGIKKLPGSSTRVPAVSRDAHAGERLEVWDAERAESFVVIKPSQRTVTQLACPMKMSHLVTCMRVSALKCGMRRELKASS